MTRARFSTRMAALVAAAAIASACSVHKQETPSLSGPSELGTSIAIQVSPDVLSQDGASQSTVTITARDSNGQPLRSLTMRVEIAVNGVIADFGTLSARTVTTDSSGRATVVYTAPMAPAVAVDSGTLVEIRVTPFGTDFGNSTSRFASIRLVPPNIVIPPDGLKPAFTVNPSVTTDHQAVLFDASTSQPTSGQNAIVSYEWDFGDGDRASGLTAQHAYDDPGTFFPKLTVRDAFGRTATAAAATNAPQGIVVSGGQAPTPSFTVSPSAPIPSQQIFFNAAATKPAPGRTIASYAWDFGDGTSGSGVQTSHAYAVAGSYTVTLMVTDDVGRTGVISQTITVASAAPTADFTFSPTAPLAGVTFVNFNAAASKASPGRSIVSYSWSFGDGTSGSGSTFSHQFSTPGTYNVILTVIDDQGNAGTVTKSVTVS